MGELRADKVSTVPVTEDEMSPAQAIFLNAYLRSWNVRGAALAAGYTAEQGKSVLASVSDVLRERLGEDFMTDEELEKRLIDIARGVGPEYLDGFGFVNFKKLIEDNKTHLIKSIQRGRDGINITFYDSQRALEIIGKTRGVVQGDVKRHLVGHVAVVDQDEMDKAIDKIYNRKLKADMSSPEIVDGEFRE